jgi:DNA repair protein RadC
VKIYEQVMTVKSWAEDDRPREKLLRHGRRSLSDAELIAILINSGNRQETSVDLSKRILNTIGNDLGALAQLTVGELTRFPGIGSAKAVSIIAALELGRRRKEVELPDRPVISDSKDIYSLMARYFEDLVHEEFRILLLSRSNKFLSHHLVSVGGQSGTIADPKIIFRIAVENKASTLVLMHNHPSGNVKPSQADIQLTRQLVSVGGLLDIPVIDHIIFVNMGYFSFADEGLI